MAQKTELSVSGYPGPVHSFVAKEAASVVLPPYEVVSVDSYQAGAMAVDDHQAGAVAAQGQPI